MKKIRFNVFLAIVFVPFVLFIAGCELYNTSVPDLKNKIVNLHDINTANDDFNTTVVNTESYYFEEKADLRFNIIYSTDRDTSGDLNVHRAIIYLKQKAENNHLTSDYEVTSEYRGEFNAHLNSQANERGPIILNYNKNIFENSGLYHSDEDSIRESGNVYSFSSDRSGDYDIYYSIKADYLGSFSPQKTVFVSESGSNERYGSYLTTEVESDYSGSLLFSSDRTGGIGGYDIYYAPLSGSGKTWDAILSDKTQSSDIALMDALSSTENDDYPYTCIIRNENNEKSIIFFSSNRAGGKGGYDIYYSFFDTETKRFLPPVNFSEVNTPHNEYRPSLCQVYGYDYSTSTGLSKYFIFLFSSDRPGGKGKIDLYMYFFSNKSWSN